MSHEMDKSATQSKRELKHISRSFSLTNKCNGKEKIFFVTRPLYIATNVTIFMTVMNTSTTSNLTIQIKSGCETIVSVIHPGSTGNFVVREVEEILYSCLPEQENCDQEQECRATVILDTFFSLSY
ncbi:hypothetical protein U0X36_05620 [Bacillus thuringiensis]|uniref:hypothetical protein n=1 Tax=Bacillus thuringiensis TaxID=1428 RepID=UPI000E4820E5|nr:hypothetical protein [Bacillus thuringiensis]MDZ3952421.1 hypothetical protein [Bacillus thuringiensis]RGP45238.1 hypothetical protein BTW32_26125 [Bacillus thuringiensis]